MALDPVPWFVGGGAEHSPDVARLLAHAATSGAGGIIGTTDLRVTQLPAANGNFRVARGAAIIPNLYENVVQQSYIARAPSVTDMPITPTGSSGGRSDMVILRIDDPQFGGQAPADPVVGPYVRIAVIEGVSSTAKTLPAGTLYPAIPLARIDLPANTATVTQALITDLRKIARPQRSRDLYNTQPTASSRISSTAWTDWTPQANRAIAIPSWASQVKVIGTISGMGVANANTRGLMRFLLGSLTGASTRFDLDASTRATLVTSDTLYVPAALRGTTATLKLQAARESGTGDVATDDTSTVIWDVEFLEVASAD